MKKLFSFLFIALTINIFAQSYVQIGSGTVSSSYPPYSVFNYGWYSAIYPQSGVGAAKYITKIAIECINGPKTLNNQKIYLKHTSQSVFSSNNYEDPTNNGYSLVFDGNLSVNGWTEITLSTPFSYNGTDNLIVNWESRYGTYNYANFNSTASIINNNKSNGSDVSFPTSLGTLNPYPSSLPNIRFYYTSTGPETPSAPSPSDLATKVNVNTTISFHLGTNTNNYDLYFGTDSLNVNNLDPTIKVVANGTVSSPGTFIYTPPAMLNSLTKYFWRVVAKNGVTTENSPLWRFITQKVINTFPFVEGFEDSSVFYPGWYGQRTEWSYTSSGNNALWGYAQSPNMRTGEYCAYASPYSGSTESSLMTPRINLQAGYRITFWWRNGDGAKIITADTTFFEISTNGGTNWTILGYNSPASAQTQYIQALYDLDAYAGNNVYMRWRYKLSNYATHKNLYLDDITISQATNVPEIQINPSTLDFGNIYVNGHTHKKVIISNNGTQNLVITSASASSPYSCSFNNTIAPASSDTAEIIFTPTSASSFNSTITFNISGSYNGTNVLQLNGEGLTPLSSFIEAFDLSTNLPTNWNKIRSETDAINDVTVVASAFDSHSQPNVCKILNMNDTISPLMLLSPGATDFSSNRLAFYAKKGGNYNLDLIVGVMDDPYDASTFVADSTINLTETHTLYTVHFDALNTKPYIAFKHGENAKITSMRIDDISWEGTNPIPPNPAVCVFPTNNSTDVDIMMGTYLRWSSGGGSPAGYRVYFGTSNPPTTLIKDTVGTSCPLNITFDYSTNYYWKVIPYNSNGNDSANCAVWTFRSMEDPTIDLQNQWTWTENFDALTQTTGFTYPLGWSYENLPGEAGQTYFGECWDMIANNPSNPNNAHSAPNAMGSGPEFYEKNNWLFTPPINFLNRPFILTFWYRMAPSGVSLDIERLRVKIGNNHHAADMTTEFLHYDSIINTDYQMADIIFTPNTGVSFIGFQAYSPSDYPNIQNFVLMIDDISISYSESIDESDIRFGIYPNPNNGNFVISCNNINYNKAIIDITNIVGQNVYSKKLDNKTENLQLDFLRKGLYFVKLNIDGKTATKKIIIN